MSSSSGRSAGADGIAIGNIAKELGISTATINFYVQQGILPAPKKLSRTRAAYSERHVRVLRLIKRLQAAGFSLGTIKQMLSGVGDDDEALQKLEGVGYLQPVQPPRLHPNHDPIELFEPVELEAFARLAELDVDTLRELERVGLLRPALPGRYDARDLATVRSARLILAAGVPHKHLAAFAEHLVPFWREVFPMTQLLLAQHLEELRRRELGFRDIIQPFMDIVGYLFNRVADAEQPRWREQLAKPPARAAAAPAAAAPRATAARSPRSAPSRSRSGHPRRRRRRRGTRPAAPRAART